MTTAAATTAAPCKCLVGGKWSDAATDRFGDVFNPSTGEVIARVPLCDHRDVDRAVAAAQRAYPAWAETPAVERARIFFRFRQLLEQHAEELARCVSREHGKTLAESRGSVLRGIEMVEYACGLSALLAGETIENIAAHVDCETIRQPVGVVAGITPFNFPFMVPLWMYPVAIVCGNCFILKPSPRVPLTAIRTAELLMQAGLPDGVLSVVHGDQSCVDALLAHPAVRAISFVGSTPVARRIYQVGTAAGKRVQAAGGAKNHVIVMPDADLDAAVAGLQNAAFGCAGQRCMAGSVAVPVGGVADELIDRLRDSAAGMRVGRTDTGAEVDMGPLITREHLERTRGYVALSAGQRATVALDGRGIQVPGAPNGFYLGPTIIDRVEPGSRLAREEIFGPVLSVTRVGSLAEALALGDACEFGNGAAIFTQSGHAAREFKRRFNAGMIGVNVGVPAPMAWFPFTGWNESFFGDLHIQGREGMQFYTQQRMTMTRWPAPQRSAASEWRPH